MKENEGIIVLVGMGKIALNDKTDEEIAKMVQLGDVESFGVLVERYEPKMLRYAQRFLFHKQDTEDQVQEVFLKAYTNIQGFDTKRKFSPWIYLVLLI